MERLNTVSTLILPEAIYVYYNFDQNFNRFLRFLTKMSRNLICNSYNKAKEMFIQIVNLCKSPKIFPIYLLEKNSCLSEPM